MNSQSTPARISEALRSSQHPRLRNDPHDRLRSSERLPAQPGLSFALPDANLSASRFIEHLPENERTSSPAGSIPPRSPVFAYLNKRRVSLRIWKRRTRAHRLVRFIGRVRTFRGGGRSEASTASRKMNRTSGQSEKSARRRPRRYLWILLERWTRDGEVSASDPGMAIGNESQEGPAVHVDTEQAVLQSSPRRRNTLKKRPPWNADLSHTARASSYAEWRSAMLVTVTTEVERRSSTRSRSSRFSRSTAAGSTSSRSGLTVKLRLFRLSLTSVRSRHKSSTGRS